MAKTISGVIEHEYIVKKSRFIVLLAPVSSRDEAMQYLAQRQTRYPDARHQCWALLAPPDSGMADDGEPSGTAGKPIMNVLQHNDMTNIFALVTRYFGGIKLGAGGLVRAYSQATVEALDLADIVVVEKQLQAVFSADFAEERDIRYQLEQLGLAPNIDYNSQGISATLTLPESKQAQVEEVLKALRIEPLPSFQ
ncbi:IMPACT family protein [Salinibius halmophilus]|uniref:IMPACT family protein n=1 Tax=Salinibius halmophilus TaxID=1853216 RepID=UPI000E674368|nr:YigZ family protein [Salinibius halmophilus]